MQINVQDREITVKVVYYGPALSGKTTNLQQLHELIRPEARSKMVTLDTTDDRTLYFDFLPVQFSSQSGFSVKVKLFTVPGQVMHKSTRKVVLSGADAVAFVADSQRASASANAYSWRDMEANLRSNGIDFARVPKVVQFNKRDLADVKPLQEIKLAWGDIPTFPAVAIRGEGVLETFRELLCLLYRDIDARYGFGAKFAVSEDEFLKGVMGNFRGGTPATDRGRLTGTVFRCFEYSDSRTPGVLRGLSGESEYSKHLNTVPARHGGEADHADRDGGARRVEVPIAVALVAAEDEGVAGAELPALARGHELDPPGLAGQVLARPGRVRDSGEVTARRELHARDLEAGDRLRQERAEPRALALAHPHLAGGEAPGRRARRADQLLDRDLERRGGARQDRERRVRRAGLEARPGGPRDPGEPGHLLLREPARLAQAPRVRGQVGAGVVHDLLRSPGPSSTGAPARCARASRACVPVLPSAE